MIRDRLVEIYRMTRRGTLLNDCLRVPKSDAQTILVEFSSPNIAKPFHVGHLRSTLIGQFIANVLSLAGHRVVKLSFPGDWGTQFGLVNRGFQEWGDEHKLESDGVRHLMDVYVKANAKADKDPLFYEEAKAWFKKLENGDVAARKFWEKIRDLSLLEFDSVYKRMGVTFDQVRGESFYVESSLTLIDSWLEQSFVKRELDGSVGIDLTSGKFGKVPRKHILLRKSDGSTLYLSRDVATLLARYDQFQFDRTLYVVGAEQRTHFEDMKIVARAVGKEWLADRIQHVAFGKVKGMQTRTGQVVLVDDLLDAGRDAAVKKILQSKNVRLTEAEAASHADSLAMNAWKLYDFKNPLIDSFKFNWRHILQLRGESLNFVQLTYARLCSVQKNAGAWEELDESRLLDDPNLALLTEPEALELIEQLADVRPVMSQLVVQLEPYKLVRYLLRLCRTANNATKRLHVERAPDEQTRLARLCLFVTTRRVIRDCLKLLEIEALDRF